MRERLLAAETHQLGPLAAPRRRPHRWLVRAEPDADAHLDSAPTCSVLHALRGTRTRATRASLRRAAEIVLAMQEPDGSFARFERGESTSRSRSCPGATPISSTSATPDDDARVVLTAMVLRELAVLGWRREDDRIASRARVARARAHAPRPHLVGRDHRRRSSARPRPSACPTDALRKVAVEQQLRTKQREDGSFGDDLATARALLAMIECGEPCVQAERAARHLVARVGRLVREQADVTPQCADHAVPGYGLSPRLKDPSAGARDIHARARRLSP